MNEINTIVSNIKRGIVKPIYFLMGEEHYYIDKISTSEYIMAKSIKFETIVSRIDLLKVKFELIRKGLETISNEDYEKFIRKTNR